MSADLFLRIEQVTANVTGRNHSLMLTLAIDEIFYQQSLLNSSSMPTVKQIRMCLAIKTNLFYAQFSLTNFSDSCVGFWKRLLHFLA